MTQVRGVWCSYCRRRYAWHVCKNGMPCEHEYARAVRNGIIGSATLIYCESWMFKGGYRKFELHKFHYVLEDGEKKKKWSEYCFSARYVDEEELIEQFFTFLKDKVQVYEWPVWMEAFVRLLFGGRSVTTPPGWRMRQLIKAHRRNRT